MLHHIPESTERARLLEVVEMQRKLLEALCDLAEDAVVDQAWLQGVWPAIPADWVKRFWENDSGNRAVWIKKIAAASPTDKQTIINMVTEQLTFAKLYDNPPTIRLTKHDWEPAVFKAANKLLKSFYDPLFYSKEGYHNSTGTKFHKDHFISGFNPRIKICPYTDNYIHDTKLDHFLPKDQFPMLSCHPDNLIPCSTDSNSGSHKGTEAPLDIEETNQGEAWFHPRLRRPVLHDTYRLTFPDGPAPQPRIKFIAVNSADQPRLDNMARMFGLYDFWGGFLDDEVQGVAGEVQDLLKEDGKEPSDANIKDYILRLARNEKKGIGKVGLAIVKSFFYEHIANTPLLLRQVVRTCTQGT